MWKFRRPGPTRQLVNSASGSERPQTHPPELFPGLEIVSSQGQEGIVGYHVSLVEIIQALGVLGFVGFLFDPGSRVFPLMPKEAPAFKRVVVVEPPVVKKAPVSATG